MQVQLFPIVYSGLSDDDIRSFISGNPLPLSCADPLYLSFDATARSYRASEQVNINFGDQQFIVIDDNQVYYGFRDHPWTKRYNLLDIYTDYGWKHWGNIFTNIVGAGSTDFYGNTSSLVDFNSVTEGNRVFLLAMSGGLPVLMSFSKETYLLSVDVRKYYLYDKEVDFFQWIKSPDGNNRIIMKYSSSIMFIDLPEGSEYTTLGAPINIGTSFASATGKGQSRNYFNYYDEAQGYDSFRKLEFYYHGDTLCAYITTATGTTFWHQDVNGRFVQDLSLPYGSYFSYYSDYNKAVNIITWNPVFIGDYRWYVVTPKSDLYTFFYNFDLSKLFRFCSSLHTDELIDDEYANASAYPISIKQHGNKVDLIFNVFQGSNSSIWRLARFTFEQPVISTALVNVNLGIPYTSLKGDFTVFGELFSEDFAWEIASKKQYQYLKGQPSIALSDYTSVNLRLTPKIPQYVSSIVYNAPENASNDIIVSRIDDRHAQFLVPYILFKDFNEIEFHIRTDISVAPFIRLLIAGDAARHCIHNAGIMCMRSRSEYKTLSCNTPCPLFTMDKIRLNVVRDAENIIGIIEDERDIFPPLQDIVHVEISMEY
jgi:hypothetical protein